jgi:hypothetical protein
MEEKDNFSSDISNIIDQNKYSSFENDNIKYNHNNKKDNLITINSYVPDRKIINVNLIIDMKNFLHNGFIERKRLLIPLFITLGYLILKKRPFFYNIKNNFEVSQSLFKRNKRIKVNFINEYNNNSNNNKDTKDIMEKTKELNLRFTYSVGYKHLNELKNLFNFSFLKYKNNKEKEIHKNNSNNWSLDIIKGIEVNLCGIKNLNEDGRLILLEILNDKKSKIYLKFNHVNYNEKPEIYVWLYVRNYKYSYSEINLNIFLMQLGLGNLNHIKLHEVYDEKIYYNFSDMLEAERNAKEKGIGIYSKERVKVARESFIKNESFEAYFDRLKTNINMKNWQRNMLNKN